VPRLSVLQSTSSTTSHDMVYERAASRCTWLHTKQFDVVRRLGFFKREGSGQAGRDAPPHRPARSSDSRRVLRAFRVQRGRTWMDTGSSTLFLGDVVAVGVGKAAEVEPRGELLTATYFRLEYAGGVARRVRSETQGGTAGRGPSLSRTIQPVDWKTEVTLCAQCSLVLSMSRDRVWAGRWSLRRYSIPTRP